MNRSERRRSARTADAQSLPLRTSAIVITVLLLISIGVFALYNARSIASSAQAPPVAFINAGDAAPPFAVTTLDGTTVDSRHVSGPMMLELFATWCPHCQHETAILNLLHLRMRNRLSIVAVSASNLGSDRTTPESEQDVRGFASYFHVGYPIAYDADLDVAKRYLQGGFPTIVFINAAKKITAIETGETPLAKLIADAQKAGVRHS